VTRITPAEVRRLIDDDYAEIYGLLQRVPSSLVGMAIDRLARMRRNALDGAAQMEVDEARAKGKVLVPVRAYDHIPSRSVLAYIDLYFGFDAPKRESKGATIEEAIANLQAIIDEEATP
jgi:hypothetical protein